MTKPVQPDLLEWAEHKFPIKEPAATKFHRGTFAPRTACVAPFDFLRDGDRAALALPPEKPIPEWLRLPTDDPDWQPGVA